MKRSSRPPSAPRAYSEQANWAENARIRRCLDAWLQDNQECSCDFPDEEAGETGTIYCDPCSLRDTISYPFSEKHEARRPKKRGAAPGGGQ